MSRVVIDEWIHLFNSAFDGRLQSVLRNLSSVAESEWAVAPTGGKRSIQDIVAHIGMFKYMYAGAAMRNRGYDYGDAPVTPDQSRLETKAAAIEWLSEAHHCQVSTFSSLEDDSELDKERLTHWGQLLPTREIMSIVLEHDTYHAGEINHIRALLQGNDEWE